jgi:hypothetical protein
MTPQELLRPRYRLYATYPGCPFKLGSVLIQKDLGATNNPYYEVGMFGLPNQSSLYNPENYPSNFCKLEWWQERSINDWPEYLRDMQGVVYKVIIQVDPTPRIEIQDVENNPVNRGFVYLTPATLEQYISYKEKYYIDNASQADAFLNQNEIR